MTTLSDIVAQFEADRAVLDGRKSVREAQANKVVAVQLRQMKGRIAPDQEAALDAEIARLDPTE